LLLLATVPALVLLAAPLWTVQEIQIDGGAHLPRGTVVSLDELVGAPLFTLDLDWVRRQVEMWPGVVGVDVHLVLPGTVRVTVESALVRGTMPVASGWHAVGRNGSLAGPVPGPRPPRLHGFGRLATELREGLAVAERLQRETGGSVEWVRRVTPSDLEVRVVLPEPLSASFTVHVAPDGSRAEERWCELIADGEAVAAWADLRWHDRLVVSAESGGRG
jgi:hypothetical protein